MRPIRWWPWALAALLAGLAFGCPVGTTVGGVVGLLVGAAAGAPVALVVFMSPLKTRGYRFPEPVALRVTYDGLHVHLREHGRWRPGTYLPVPWQAIGGLELVDAPGRLLPASPSLRIRLNLAGRDLAARHSAAARRAVDADGCLVVPQIVTPALLAAVDHYSGGRFPFGPP